MKSRRPLLATDPLGRDLSKPPDWAIVDQRNERVTVGENGLVSRVVTNRDGMVISHDPPQYHESVDVPRLIAAARKAVMGAQPFASAWEFDPYAADLIDGEDLHTELREALGISLEEWQARE